MNMSWNVTLGAIVVLSTLVAGCSNGGSDALTAGGGVASSSLASIAALKQQAQGERGLVVYANVPSQYFQPVVAAFNRVYPGIKVSETDLNDNTVFSKYQAAAAQSARTADLLIASAPASWVQAEQAGVSAKVTQAPQRRCH